MSVLHNRINSRYATVPDSLINDIRISPTARFIYVYLSSKPDGWEICNSDVQKNIGIKDKNTIAKLWNELVSLGWIERIKKSNGTFDYILKDLSPVIIRDLEYISGNVRKDLNDANTALIFFNILQMLKCEIMQGSSKSNGKYFVKKSDDWIARKFPGLSEQQVHLSIKKLINSGYLAELHHVCGESCFTLGRNGAILYLDHNWEEYKNYVSDDQDANDSCKKLNHVYSPEEIERLLHDLDSTNSEDLQLLGKFASALISLIGNNAKASCSGNHN